MGSEVRRLLEIFKSSRFLERECGWMVGSELNAISWIDFLPVDFGWFWG